jgi:hypothetical protein
MPSDLFYNRIRLSNFPILKFVWNLELKISKFKVRSSLKSTKLPNKSVIKFEIR